MTTLAINQNQNRLLAELISIMPLYDGVQVIDVLKSALAGLKKCKKIEDAEVKLEQAQFSEKITSLIGIIPDFSEEELQNDERLSHILNH